MGSDVSVEVVTGLKSRNTYNAKWPAPRLSDVASFERRSEWARYIQARHIRRWSAPLLKLLPNIGAETIPECNPDAALLVPRRFLRVHQVPVQKEYVSKLRRISIVIKRETYITSPASSALELLHRTLPALRCIAQQCTCVKRSPMRIAAH